MSSSDFPRVKSWASTTLDLKIIEKQLSDIEVALLRAYHSLKYAGGNPEDMTPIVDGIDTLLTLKKSFGFVSPVLPVVERQSAVVAQKQFEDERA